MTCHLQVASTVSKVLEDMKRKYDAANKQSAQARSQEDKSKSDLDMIKQVQKAKLEEIKKLCRSAHQLVMMGHCYMDILVPVTLNPFFSFLFFSFLFFSFLFFSFLFFSSLFCTSNKCECCMGNRVQAELQQ